MSSLTVALVLGVLFLAYDIALDDGADLPGGDLRPAVPRGVRRCSCCVVGVVRDVPRRAPAHGCGRDPSHPDAVEPGARPVRRGPDRLPRPRRPARDRQAAVRRIERATGGRVLAALSSQPVARPPTIPAEDDRGERRITDGAAEAVRSPRVCPTQRRFPSRRSTARSIPTTCPSRSSAEPTRSPSSSRSSTPALQGRESLSPCRACPAARGSPMLRGRPFRLAHPGLRDARQRR